MMARIYLDPEILAIRVSAKLGGLPFQIEMTVGGKRDKLVVDCTAGPARMVAHAAHQPAVDFRSWGASEFGDLEPAMALGAVRSDIQGVIVSVLRNSKLKKVREFADWSGLMQWLKNTNEKVERFTVEFPRSTYKAAKKLAARRKKAGGQGAIKNVVIAATEEYLEKHSE